MNHDTGTYYDRLERWTSLARMMGYGGGRDSLTVHRALVDPRAGGAPTPTRLHDIIVETLPPLTAPRVLDAGCGLGGTMIDFARRIGGTYTGLTLSERQARIGRQAIASAGLAERIKIEVRSYDTPPEAEFDLVVAIESCAHSQNPQTSLAALASRLAPGGVLAIVDDMPKPAAEGSPDLAAFKAGWRLPELWGREDFIAGLDDCGLTLTVDRDLSSAVRPRRMGQIVVLETLNRIARSIAPSAGLHAILDSYYGGLALERLYRNALISYRLLLACNTARNATIASKRSTS